MDKKNAGDKKNTKISVLLVGEAATGKTSLIGRFINNSFTPNTSATIGIDYRTKKIRHNGMDIKLEIWDTAGQERYQALPSAFYARADAIAVVFSLTDSESFGKVEGWIESIVTYKSLDQVSIALLGNKKDLVEERVVGDEDINKLKDDKNIKYFAVSAKSGEGVDEVFQYFTEEVCKRKNLNPPETNDKITLDKSKSTSGDKNDKKRRCC